MISAAERHRAMTDLLKKEAKLLQTIDRLKIAANMENKKTRIDRELTTVLYCLLTLSLSLSHTHTYVYTCSSLFSICLKMAAKKKWENEEADIVHVDTPFTVRAKELMDLYNGLGAAATSTLDERLDVLLHVKWTVKVHTYTHTRFWVVNICLRNSTVN